MQIEVSCDTTPSLLTVYWYGQPGHASTMVQIRSVGLGSDAAIIPAKLGKTLATACLRMICRVTSLESDREP